MLVNWFNILLIFKISMVFKIKVDELSYFLSLILGPSLSQITSETENQSRVSKNGAVSNPLKTISPPISE